MTRSAALQRCSRSAGSASQRAGVFSTHAWPPAAASDCASAAPAPRTVSSRASAAPDGAPGSRRSCSSGDAGDANSVRSALQVPSGSKKPPHVSEPSCSAPCAPQQRTIVGPTHARW